MQAPNPFYAGQGFGPATAYGLLATVRAVISHGGGGAFSLPPRGDSRVCRPNPPHTEGEFIPTAEVGGFLRHRRREVFR